MLMNLNVHFLGKKNITNSDYNNSNQSCNNVLLGNIMIYNLYSHKPGDIIHAIFNFDFPSNKNFLYDNEYSHCGFL